MKSTQFTLSVTDMSDEQLAIIEKEIQSKIDEITKTNPGIEFEYQCDGSKIYTETFEL